MLCKKGRQIFLNLAADAQHMKSIFGFVCPSYVFWTEDNEGLYENIIRLLNFATSFLFRGKKPYLNSCTVTWSFARLVLDRCGRYNKCMCWLLQGDWLHHDIMAFSMLSGLNITSFQKLWNLFWKISKTRLPQHIHDFSFQDSCDCSKSF